MLPRLRNVDARWWTAALLGAAVMGWLGLTGFAWTDYDTEAAPAFAALMAGDVEGFLAKAPAYGGSFVLRAPFAAIAALLGGGELAVFRAVAIPCLLAGAMLGMALVGRMRERGVERSTQALVLALCVANPITLRALEIGHPEELLGAALCIGAVLAAGGRRDLLAAVLLGLAIATKLWAVLAIGPVLLAMPERRLRALVVAGSVASAVIAPLLLAGSGDTIITGASQTGTIFQPWQVFWPLGELGTPVVGTDGLVKPDYLTPPAWLSPLTHPGIALLVIPLSALWWARHRRRVVEPEQLLGLLALLFLLRCVLDPWNNVYYALPFLLALLSWEALTRTQRPPVLALACTALVWTTFEEAPAWVGPDVQSAVYLIWALPLCAWLAREVFGTPRAVAGETVRRSARRATARTGEISIRPGARLG